MLIGILLRVQHAAITDSSNITAVSNIAIELFEHDFESFPKQFQPSNLRYSVQHASLLQFQSPHSNAQALSWL